MTVIIYTFTVQLYNIYTLKYSVKKKRKSCSPSANVCTVLKRSGFFAHRVSTERKGLNSDRRFILQYTRQLNTGQHRIHSFL